MREAFFIYMIFNSYLILYFFFSFIINHIFRAMKGLIIIPAYDAENTLPDVLKDLGSLKNLEVLVVNDGSRDSTSQIAKLFSASLIEHSQNKGKGAAIKTGIDYALKQDVDFVITFDADGQHRACDIPGIIKQHEQYPDSVILGTRLRDDNMPGIRKFSNSVIAAMVSWRIGKKLYDAQCGLRLIPKKHLNLELSSLNGFIYEAEVLIGWAENDIDLRTFDIPTIYHDQHSSKITYIDSTLIYLYMYFASFFKSYKQRRT